MGQALYLECSSGISGDMLTAALLDLGADKTVLQNALKSLPVDGYEVKISRVKKSGLDVCDFDVKLDAVHENHDHDMEYLHGHGPDHAQEHSHMHEHSHGDDTEGLHGHTHDDAHEQTHDHAHEHTHDHVHEHTHEHAHEHRGLPEIQEMIRRADLTKRAKDTALRVFDLLASAEAKAHGLPVEQVHFHEVGAVDSIVDIVAAAVCLDNLDITEVIVPELCEGRGFIRCQHGVIPVPVPAVLNIVQAEGLTLHLTDVQGELVTPTGAALVAAVKTSSQLPDRFRVLRTGMGAGKRIYECPGILRAMVIVPEKQEKKTADFPCDEIKEDRIVRLETNIDDSSGETLGHCMERLLEAGARDVYFIPAFMKKNRPAVQLNVICGKDQVRKLEQILFEETTTIGIRRGEMDRTILPRKIKIISTPLGDAEVKVCILPDGTIRLYPEYDSVSRLAKANNLSFPEAFALVKASAV